MQNFDYQFNVGGNFTATMEGMAESTGRFNAAVEGTHSWLGKLGQTLAVWDLASNYVSSTTRWAAFRLRAYRLTAKCTI